jgi:hypothetical protein
MGRRLVPLPLLQCSLGSHSHGLPFGTVVSHRHGVRDNRDIATYSEQVDWARFVAYPPDNLPKMADGGKRGTACLVMLLLFVAFPWLKRVCRVLHRCANGLVVAFTDDTLPMRTHTFFFLFG